MGTCFFVLVFLLAGLFIVATAVRWFEQIADAVRLRQWNKTTLLVLMPFAAWLFPSRVSAGRPTAVPRHEPVRGFGGLPRDRGTEARGLEGTEARGLEGTEARRHEGTEAADSAGDVPPRDAPADAPPPGTPKEFIGMPKIPPKRPKPPIDPDKLAKLRQKMRDQGMLDDDRSDA